LKFAKAAGAFLFGFLVFYLVLVYAAEFTNRQSIVLALLITLLARETERVGKWRKPFSRFQPYYVAVSPRWGEILTEFKMIDSPEELEVLLRSPGDRTARDYQVLLDGIFFTVTHESRDLKRTLIYRNDHRSFRSKVEIHEGMAPLTVKNMDKHSLRDHWTPEFFMVRGLDGYDLGIRVPEAWWAAMKSSCPRPAREHFDHLCGQVDLTLAVVPWREFDLQW
jgi:hypothetical protein